MRGVIPRLVLGEVGPGQGQGLGSKAGIARNEARARSWIVHQGLYRTKCNQDQVRGWVPILVWGRNGSKAGSGTGGQGRYWMKWGEDRVRDWPK